MNKIKIEWYEFRINFTCLCGMEVIVFDNVLYLSTKTPVHCSYCGRSYTPILDIVSTSPEVYELPRSD